MEFTLPFFPQEASSVAGQVDLMFAVWVVISLFFTALIAVLILAFMVRYRRKSVDEVGASEKAGMWLEVTWSVIPLLIMLAMFAWGARVYYEVHVQPTHENVVQYWGTGRQWMWKFQHPEGNREINSLHLPLGQAVQLTLTSEDVIHNVSIPAFRLKQDVVPGTYVSIWFKPTKVGEYHLFCSQYCGAEHSKMTGTVTVMEPLAYAAWLSGGPAAGQSPVASGAQLFQSLACVTCHTAAPGREQRGPSLNGVFGHPVALEGGRTVIADESYVRESILTPMAKVVLGYQPVMPTFQGQVSEEQLAQLVAYVKSLGNAAPAAAAAPAAGEAKPAGATDKATGSTSSAGAAAPSH
ncbi:MAG TPA: cytochrome c oxidase subunit II [Thermoanaerobaculia bacterium]